MGGTSLYLGGHAAFWKRVGHIWKPDRLLAAAALLGLIPVAAIVSPLIALVLVVVVLVGTVTFERLRYADQRAAVRRRPGEIT